MSAQAIDSSHVSVSPDAPAPVAQEPPRAGRARSRHGFVRLLSIGAAVTVAYVLAANLGFTAAFVAEQVTTVWPPTGLSIAALLLWGRRLWPAVWAGAFLANATSTAPLWTAAAIATGNTLEAVVAVWALRSLPRFDPALRRVSDVLGFCGIAALLATTVSATIGVATLCAAGVQPWMRFQTLWFEWWFGDAIGALVVAPAILATARRTAWTPRERTWALLLVTTAVLATHLVFGQVVAPGGAHPLEYVIFPFVIAGAMRGGPPVTSLVVLGTVSVALWGTISGAGPFATGEVHESLILLQTFTGILAGTGLLLAAAISERETSERRRTAAYAVGDVLAASPDPGTAAPAILRALCTNLDWQMGALWLVDQRAGVLRCESVWSETPGLTAAFERVTREAVFVRGIGLPGRVWATGTAAWIEDVRQDRNFPRAAAVRDPGVRGGFGFPILLGETFLGVIECFNRSVVAADPDLLRTMSTVGNQVGQFIGRKRQEMAVLAEQRRTAAIVETALDGVIGMDEQGRITEFNPAATRIFGYSRDEAVGRQLAELVIPPHLRQAHREGLARHLAGGGGPFLGRRMETTGYRADGRELPVEVAVTRVADDPPLFTGFVRDLSARVQAERERQQLLEREAGARSAAEAASRAKDEFLATLSHELRTPLNAIVGWARMLLDGTLDSRSARRALEIIDRNAQLQARLVSDILDVSRIITGRLRLDLRPVDLEAVIGASIDAVRPAADARQIQLRSRLTASPRIVRGDPARLQQIVWNLLANAVKFTAPGGTVTVELTDADERGLDVRVSDDGAGIAPEFLPHVFERFRQADGSMTRQHGGLGLGLAIVRHLVELHGGTVRAESEGVGRGAAFTVTLPAEDIVQEPVFLATTGAGDDPPPKENRPAGALHGYRLLVVEDQAEALELLETILKSEGAAVETATSVGEALGRLEAHTPDAVLADLGMPQADGYALVAAIRARDGERGRRLPAAALTAYAADQDRARALAAGFDAHVAKPLSRTVVVETVLAICRGGTGRP